MASTSNLELTAPSSQPSSWDVFLSFRGDDTRGNFTSHVYKALDGAGFETFMDDELEKGEEISSGLFGAIGKSKMFVVVISENYARSSWCLDELVQILACKSRDNQVVPVFYHVDPSDIRHQRGCFREALDHHKERCSNDLIDKWKSALAQVAELSGYHLQTHGTENESEIIQQIVKDVERQVSTKLLHLEENLIKIDFSVKKIYQKLRMEVNHVRAIGICGMGGIGKTTTAKAFYNKYFNRFDISCFIDKVKQYSRGGSLLLLPLLNQVLIGLLRQKDSKVTSVESGFRKLEHYLRSKKALIVLDDLDQLSYSEFLVRLCNSFSSGSRIIVTTRDVNLLNQLRTDIKEVDIYKVETLGEVDSLELFSYHAFRTPRPPTALRVLSESFVAYASGLPLALKVLGSSLRGSNQDESFWEAKLKKVKEISEEGILENLQLSYDELGHDTDKAIFLDIAFFFVGKSKDEADKIFESCHFYPKEGIRILVERSLLTVDENDKFQMHDLIQQMGRRLAKKTRLFLRGNPWEDLQNQKEPDKIEGLILDFTESKEQIDSQIFNKLPKLRLLEILGAPRIKGDFQTSLDELRCFYWRYCTWTQLPSSFRPKNLVVLIMPSSNFQNLWTGSMPFTSLKIINVDNSVNLKTTPDLGNSKLVERLGLRGCESLQKLHPSVTELTRLCALDVRACTHLRELPKQLGEMKSLTLLDASYSAIKELPDSITQLKGLFKLDLSDCNKLRKLPEEIGNMEGLKIFSASNTAIKQLPDSFVGLINLVKLGLSGCTKLDRLPEQLGKMQCLKHLGLNHCENLKYVPDSIWNLTSLTHLYLLQPDIVGTNLPNTLNDTKLVALSLNCDIRLWLPTISSFSLLEELHLRDEGEGLSSAETFSLTKLYNLRFLQLDGSKSFGSSFLELPPNLTHLSLSDNATLEYLPDLSSLKQLNKLDIIRYLSLKSLPPLPPRLESLAVIHCKELHNLPDMSILKDLIYLSFGNLKPLSLRNYVQVSNFFSYQSSECTLHFTIPPPSEDDFLGLALWVCYDRPKNKEKISIRAVVTNETSGITTYCGIPVYCEADDIDYSLVKCISRHEILIRSGDSMHISFEGQLHSFLDGDAKVPWEEVKMDLYGAHVMQKSAKTPSFSSYLNSLISDCGYLHDVSRSRFLLRSLGILD